MENVQPKLSLLYFKQSLREKKLVRNFIRYQFKFCELGNLVKMENIQLEYHDHFLNKFESEKGDEEFYQNQLKFYEPRTFVQYNR